MNHLNIHMGKKMNIDPYLISYTKMNSKLTTDLNAEVNTMKLLGENLCDFVWGENVYISTTKHET